MSDRRRTAPKPCPTCYAPMQGTPLACERHGVPPPPKPFVSVARTARYKLRVVPAKRVARIVCGERGESWAIAVGPGEYRCERCGKPVRKPVDVGDGARVKVVA